MARRRISAVFEIIITYQMVIFCYGYICYHNKLKIDLFRVGCLQTLPIGCGGGTGQDIWVRAW